MKPSFLPFGVFFGLFSGAKMLSLNLSACSESAAFFLKEKVRWRKKERDKNSSRLDRICIFLGFFAVFCGSCLVGLAGAPLFGLKRYAGWTWHFPTIIQPKNRGVTINRRRFNVT